MLIGETPQEPEPKWYLIYPNNRYKFAFDVFIGIVLLYSCNTTAVQLAFFSDDPSEALERINLFVDILFYIDILATFFSVVEDKSLN